jgi:hypothetical protein
MSVDYAGYGPITTFPKPGGFIVEGDEQGRDPREDDNPDEKSLDPRVRWSDTTFARLRSNRQEATAQMRRNRDLYDNKHWGQFGSGRRPPWKLAAVINFCAWVVDRKVAVLTDNKPKTTFSAFRREDDWQAEIMSAAFDEFYEDEHVQEKLEDLVKLGEIDKISWLHPSFDPLRGTKGAARLDVVSGMAVYCNKEATNVDNATHLCWEYTLPYGEVVTRWPRLRGKKIVRLDAGDEPTDSQSPRPQPATSYNDDGQYPSRGGPNTPTGTDHAGPYSAGTTTSEPAYAQRILIRDWWTRPYGPNYETTVDSLVFTVAGQLSTRRKMIELEDGTREPLQTVVTEGNIVYELPMSTALLLEWASGIGGLKILGREDALEVETKELVVPLYPYGRHMIIAGREVADDGANHLAFGSWPWIPYRSNRDGRSMTPQCNIDKIATLQDALNRIVGMVFDAANLMGNPIWRLPLNAEVADEALTNAPGAIVREDVQSLRFGKRESGVEIPNFVMQYISFLIEQILKITNTTDIGSGNGKTKGQQSAETVNMYQEAAGVGNRPSMRELERVVVELGNQFRGIVAQFYTDSRIARIKNDMGVENHREYVGMFITGKMKMHAKAGSGLPQSPSARLQVVQQLMATPAMDVPELLRNLEEVGIIESASSHLKRLFREKSNPLLTWLIPALSMPPPGGKKKNAKKDAGRSARATTSGAVAARG